MIESRLLRALVILLEVRSVTQAADRLNITQPAMSATLRRLRDVFEDPLFVRSASGLMPTERAEQAGQHAVEILERMQALEQTVVGFDPMTDPLDLHLTASDFVYSSILPRAMQMLLQEAPLTNLVVQSLDLGNLDLSLENGTLDFAVLPAFLAPQGARIRKLFEEQFVYLMRRNHPIGKSPLTMQTLSRCAHLGVRPVLPNRAGRVDRIFSQQGLVRNIRLTTSSYSAVAEIVSDTDLVALYPRRWADRLGDGLIKHEVPFDLEPISMCLIWHPRKQTSRSHAWARDFLARVAKQIYGEQTQRRD